MLIGTFVAVLYRANDLILFANHRVLNQSAWPTYRRWITNSAMLVCMIWGFKRIPLNMDTYVHLFGHAMWISVCVCVIFAGVNSLLEKQARIIAWGYIKNIMSALKSKKA